MPHTFTTLDLTKTTVTLDELRQLEERALQKANDSLKAEWAAVEAARSATKLRWTPEWVLALVGTIGVVGIALLWSYKWWDPQEGTRHALREEIRYLRGTIEGARSVRAYAPASASPNGLQAALDAAVTEVTTNAKKKETLKKALKDSLEKIP